MLPYKRLIVRPQYVELQHISSQGGSFSQAIFAPLWQYIRYLILLTESFPFQAYIWHTNLLTSWLMNHPSLSHLQMMQTFQHNLSFSSSAASVVLSSLEQQKHWLYRTLWSCGIQQEHSVEIPLEIHIDWDFGQCFLQRSRWR